jgi:hypothetical protein
MRYFRYDFRLKTTWGMSLAIRNFLDASDFDLQSFLAGIKDSAGESHVVS